MGERGGERAREGEKLPIETSRNVIDHGDSPLDFIGPASIIIGMSHQLHPSIGQ